jgi:ribose 5-phosphate isomerase B
MRIAVGSDHAGYELKRHIVEWLAERGVDHTDVGARALDPEDDYPDFARAVCRAVLSRECDFGIIICATGVGSCIAANKLSGIRAALCGDTFCAKYSRLHNDANVLCLGGRVVGPGLALQIVETWIGEPFGDEERHRRRLEKVARLEERGKG